MPFVIATDGVPIHYRSMGTGQPIILVHAWTMNGRFFEPNMRALAEKYRVITIDMRGHGRSGKDLINLTMRQLGRDINAVIEHLDLRNVVLGGWSMGMTATYNYLSEFGTGRLAGVISIDMSPRILSDEGWPHATYGGMTATLSLAFQARILDEGLPALAAEILPMTFATGAVVSPEMAELVEAESASVPTLAALALWVSMSSQDWRALLPKIDVPFLVTQGGRSACYPTDVWRYIADHAPDARVEIFEESGHSPHIEEVDRFNRVVDAFVASL